jgi:hypothetical protein
VVVFEMTFSITPPSTPLNFYDTQRAKDSSPPAGGDTHSTTWCGLKLVVIYNPDPGPSQDCHSDALTDAPGEMLDLRGNLRA